MMRVYHWQAWADNRRYEMLMMAASVEEARAGLLRHIEGYMEAHRRFDLRPLVEKVRDTEPYVAGPNYPIVTWW